MRISPLFSGLMYMMLAGLFTYLAINNVNKDGWNVFSFFLVLLATLDFGAGIRLVGLHFRLQKLINKK